MTNKDSYHVIFSIRFDNFWMSIIIDCLVPNVDLPALASSEFKFGPPSELAQTATHFMLEVLVR